MKAFVPALAPVLRSNAQGDLLALLFLHEDAEFSLADIARRIGALPATVHREVGRLVQSGLVTDRSVGRSRLVRVNPEHELHHPLRELILLSYGPRVVLELLTAELAGVERAYIYGSWAARYTGEIGAVPRDIDLLVVGSTSRDVLEDVAREAEAILGREVNPTRVSAQEWDGDRTPFITTVKSRPLVPLRSADSAA